MRTVQQIFDTVIEAGYYPKNNNKEGSCDWMCIAVQHAYINKIIDIQECYSAINAIDQYIGINTHNLEVYLDMRNLPTTIKYRLALYQNWENRP